MMNILSLFTPLTSLVCSSFLVCVSTFTLFPFDDDMMSLIPLLLLFYDEYPLDVSEEDVSDSSLEVEGEEGYLCPGCR